MVAAFLDTRPFGFGAASALDTPFGGLAFGDDALDDNRFDDNRFDDNRFDDNLFDGAAFRAAARTERVAPATPRSPRSRQVTRVEYRRRRTVAVGLVVAILLGLFMALQALLGRSVGGPLASVGSPGSAQPAVARIWVVRPGDTLWTIALASGARGDIRPLVDKMSAEVGGKPLQPGERILVP